MTCKPVPAAVWDPKPPTAVYDYAVNFEEECARVWSRLRDFSAGQNIRVYAGGKSVGFEFEPTTPGRTGLSPPYFPSVIGATVADGSVIWTCRALSAASLLRTVDGVPTWDADDGVIVSDEAVVGFEGRAKIGGGEDDEDYMVLVTATTTDGLVFPKHVILPVRVPVKIC